MNALILASALLSQEWEESYERAAPEVRKRAESAARLSEEVSLLNLLNGLNLSKEQARQVIALAKEAEKLRESAAEKRDRAVREFEEALRELKKCLLTCGHIPPEVEQRVGEKEAQVEEARRSYLKDLRALEKKLCGVLTRAQLRVIDTFSPCLIPPRELTDPVRVGQAGGETAEIEEQLEWLRDLPESVWKPAAEAFFAASLEHDVPGEKERRRETDRLVGLLREARGLSDERFAVEKVDLAAELRRPAREREEQEREMNDHYLDVYGGLTLAGKYLLNPRVAPLLEEKMKHECRTPRADLDKIEPAESCRTCGRKPPAEGSEEGPGSAFESVAAWLGLSTDQATRARAAVVRGQVARWDLLATLREYFRALYGGEELEPLLSRRAPGGEATYAERIEEIRAEVDSALQDVLTVKQWEKYGSSGIDLFEVKVGRLRCKKE